MERFRATTNKYALMRRFGGSGASPNAKYSDTFTTATQQLTVPGTYFNFGTNPFTVELWVYPTAIANGSYYDLIDSDNGSVYFTFGIVGQPGGGVLRFVFNNGAGGTASASQSTGNLSTATWYHIALMRNGDSTSLFVNGICRATVSGMAALSINTGLIWRIGGNSAGANQFIGSLTNVRIVSDYNVYSFGTTVGTQYFIPPSAPLENIGRTQLLIQGLSDVSPNALTVTNVGVVTTGSTPSPFA